MNQATPSSVGQPARSPGDASLRILNLRRQELAAFARHLDRLRRRLREHDDHLAHTRRQLDGLLERSRQQIAHIQSSSPERIAELEKALALARSEVETQRQVAARLAADKARLEARLAAPSGAPPQLAELQQALAQARHELETQRSEVARMTAENHQIAGKALHLEQALAQSQKELQTTRRQIQELQEAANRIGQLEELLSAAAAELESREQQLAELRRAAPAPADSPDLEAIIAQVRAEFEDIHQSEIQRLNLDLDALRKGNARLRQELETRQAQGPGSQPPAAATAPGDQALARENEELKARLAAIEISVEKLADENRQLRSQPAPAGAPDPAIVKENEELKARLATIEASVQKLFEENQRFRSLAAELEQERNSAIETLERESAQFNQQRRDLEDELQALRKKFDETEHPPAVESGLDSMPDIMAGEIVPEPDSEEEIDLEPPTPEVTIAPLSAVNLEQGFDFSRAEAKLANLKRQIENDHRLLRQELSDPQARPDDRQLTDLGQHRILMDSLTDQIRRAQEHLIGRPTSPPVVVAPPQPARAPAKPRRSFQGLRRWLKGDK